MPHRIESWTAGRRAGSVEFTNVALGVEWDPDLLVFPEDAKPAPAVGVAPTDATELQVTELGEGVYLVPAASYNSIFMSVDDYVFVLEAPVSPQVSRAVVTKIAEVLPAKPVRYAAISHFHFDHSGGLWPYIADGTVIVTTEGNREFVRQVATAPRSLEGEQLNLVEPIVETVRGKRVFGHGDRRVELYEVPNPHVDELLIAYIPHLKLMFVADLYSFNGQVTPANDQALALAKRVEELGLDIETVVPVHGQQTTGDNFWESVRLGREQGR